MRWFHIAANGGVLRLNEKTANCIGSSKRADGKLNRLVETGGRQIASVRRNGWTAYCIEPFGRADGVLYKSTETCGRYIDIGLPQ